MKLKTNRQVVKVVEQEVEFTKWDALELVASMRYLKDGKRVRSTEWNGLNVFISREEEDLYCISFYTDLNVYIDCCNLSFKFEKD